MRFWATSGGHFDETEKTTVTATSRADIKTSAQGLASMISSDHPTSTAPTPCGNGPTLKALVDIANAPHPEEPAAKAKGKAKAKPKAKAAAQVPKTPAEHRNAIRPLDVSNIVLVDLLYL